MNAPSKDPPVAPATADKTASREPFAAALRAEIEALVGRYEAMSRAHQEALQAAREHETARLRQELAVLLADRERSRAQETDLRTQLRAQQERATTLERDLGQARQQLDEARQRREALEVESARLLAQERQSAQRAQQELEGKLATAQAQLSAARSEASARLAQVEGALREVQQEAESLSEAFSAERTFVEACAGLEGSALLEALRGALGAELTASPGTFAAIKARRPDSLLTLALKERGRTVVTAPLTERERTALPRLAQASGCELIAPEHGVRFNPTGMDKASTMQDPSEEGNVLECLLPGLRLAGTEGSLVFPRVVVATG